MREVKLPSGAVLKVNAAPFADAKALYQAVLKEIKLIPMTTGKEIPSMLKDSFCAGFSSPEVDAALEKCMQRCLYNDLKIDADTFEPTAAREDYVKVCVEVVKDNVGPFVKSLYADYQSIMRTIGNILG